MSVPLAEKMRPTKLNEVVGQEHLIGKGKILSEIISKKLPTNLIFWGPAGSGKTTLARIFANETGAVFKEISAVTSGKSDIMRVIEDAKINNRLDQKTILFVDEIHRFLKSQQDAFLPYVEDGTIILVGATTENPSFEVIRPLISRSKILVLEPLDVDDILKIINKSMKVLGINTKRLPVKSQRYLAKIANGDGRVALNNLELAINLESDKITEQTIATAAQSSSPHYDKNSEQHYNVISAFIKSMRGSDPTAAVYYLARMLQSGEDPKFIARRMVVFASEDVGIAAPAALNLAVSTFLAVERVGMPECEHNLYHCAIVLAKTDKSRQVTDVMAKAKELARTYPNVSVPFHLRSKATRRQLKSVEFDKTKKANTTDYGDGFLPDEIRDLRLL